MRTGDLLRDRVEVGVRRAAVLSAGLRRWSQRMAGAHPGALRAAGAGLLFVASVAVAGPRQTLAGLVTTAVVSASFLVVPTMRWPAWLITAAATGGAVVMMLAGAPESPYRLYLVTAILVFSLRNEMAAVILVTGAVWGVFALAYGVTAALPDGDDLISLEALPSVLAAAALGQAIRANQARRVMLEERARRAEQSREEEARRRVQAERLRIARDLHDAVGHQVALISVQAGAMTFLLDTDIEKARISLAHIQDAGEAALEELRLSVGLLRQAGEHEPVEPAGRLSGLDALVASFAAAGLRVTCEVTGPARPLPEAVDLTAFRLVQESLTNAAKHATGSRATVRLNFRPGTLSVTVENEGPAAGGRDAVRPGHGIIGMHERAATLGGQLTAGPRPEGGFRVTAELPAPAGAPR
ncbi:sensor histidine kinase [Dactylosporangium sp. AC04546]|uniref:sensor histidine kinase n=1 Tax=Dactylosporangium sp. AC04546 TaxID=2862460 RepID=UPI001EDD841C|nr:sensor histidine kinase [Dactylosporangium sp. AC04546]WVK89283.1 sensor histidine kinase [Dactylosporangium sp. AC04546]